MDPILNPYSPGAGMPPPELAGREDILGSVSVALARTRAGRLARSAILLGLRGVGKTVLLLRMREDAEAGGLLVMQLDAPESRSLPVMLAPGIRRVLIQLARKSRAREPSRRALRALAGFVGALKGKYRDIEVGLDLDPQPGLADSGDLELDLPELLETVGHACRSAETGLLLVADELQHVAKRELAALAVALRRTAQRRLPVLLIGAGLPPLRARLARTGSDAEHLFDYTTLGPLAADAAARAIAKPAAAPGVEYDDDALSLIVRQSDGHPYFLQECGRHVWNTADRSPIARADVVAATPAAVASLDESFFLVGFDRLTPAEKRYLRAMAELGAGPHRSGDIASELGRAVTSLGPLRAQLISKGMVWSPEHGSTAFTVPRFDGFMRRIMRGEGWRDRS